MSKHPCHPRWVRIRMSESPWRSGTVVRTRLFPLFYVSHHCLLKNLMINKTNVSREYNDYKYTVMQAATLNAWYIYDLVTRWLLSRPIYYFHYSRFLVTGYYVVYGNHGFSPWTVGIHNFHLRGCILSYVLSFSYYHSERLASVHYLFISEKLQNNYIFSIILIYLNSLAFERNITYYFVHLQKEILVRRIDKCIFSRNILC